MIHQDAIIKMGNNTHIDAQIKSSFSFVKLVFDYQVK